MEVVLTDLMVLFDDFDEKQDPITQERFHNFICSRDSEVAELTIFPKTGKLSIVIRSKETIVCAMNLMHCDYVKAYLKEKIMVMVSGYESGFHVKCDLIIGNAITLFIEPNWNSEPIWR